MFGLDILVHKVLLIGVIVLAGVILRKLGKVDSGISVGLSNTVIYVAQPAMIIYGFLEATFSLEILWTSLCVLAFSTVFHLLYYVVARMLYKNVPEGQQMVLRFATIFSNAGFMGIPLISELISPIAAVYATFYVVSFNIFSWSLGCYIYTGDKKYISAKKMFINPATIPTYIGLVFFAISGLVSTGTVVIPESVKPVADFIVIFVRDNVLKTFSAVVLPLSMIMVGFRLAECKIKYLITDKNIAVLTVVRLLLMPVAVIGIMKLVILTGLFPDSIIIPASTVLAISASTPAAAMTNILAEWFGKDAVYASKAVSSTTLLSLVTMPVICAILLAVF